MASKFETWRKNIRHHPFITIGIIVLLVVCIAFLLAIHWWGWDWTGFNRYIGPQLRTNQQYRPEKTLWDWLQLLIIPFMLAIGGFWLNKIQKDRDERVTEQRDKTEREITADNQREAAFQAYLDKMSELLLHEKLRTSAEEDEVRKIARVRTLTVLRGLDPSRKASVIRFLHESGLIDKDKCIINLIGADLSKANLIGADLRGTQLHGAKLSEANLMAAKLSETNLIGADLREANLIGADLREADLREANLMAAFFFANDLSGADLREAYLMAANLGGANLSGADLREAYLMKANLGGVNLSGAFLDEVHLEDATGVTVEELEKQAISLKGATMPNGSKRR